MDKGPDNVTQTTSQEPPSYLQGPLRGAANASGQLFNQGPQQYYPGQTVVPFSGQTNLGLNLQQNRALQGNDAVNAAQDYTTNLLQNDTLQNPMLDDALNRQAGFVNNQFDTIMARSGRDLTGNLGARADALSDASSKILGNAFESQAGRQMQAASMAPQFANQDLINLNLLRDVGSTVEGQAGRLQADRMNRFNFAQQAPGQNLDQYIARLMGQNTGGTSSSTQPVFNNPLGSALGAGITGASLFGAGGPLAGTFGLGGPAGFGIGAGLGLLGVI